MPPMNDLLLLLGSGLVAGAIDSIAGGGGLITLPTLSLAVGQGVDAIATNKIVGSAGALMALLVYMRRNPVPWRIGLEFSFWIMLGSTCGSNLTPYLPKSLFPWFLLATYPVILWTVWEKDIWIREGAREAQPRKRHGLLEPRLMLAGLACGFYDGMWGPGGGTFMLLALLLVVRLPLMPAVVASKLANTVSASTALIVYGTRGHVHVTTGVLMAAGMCAGAFIGASLATKRASTVVRPVLAFVATLLVLKNVLGHYL